MTIPCKVCEGKGLLCGPSNKGGWVRENCPICSGTGSVEIDNEEKKEVEQANEDAFQRNAYSGSILKGRRIGDLTLELALCKKNLKCVMDNNEAACARVVEAEAALEASAKETDDLQAILQDEKRHSASVESKARSLYASSDRIEELENTLQDSATVASTLKKNCIAWAESWQIAKASSRDAEDKVSELKATIVRCEEHIIHLELALDAKTELAASAEASLATAYAVNAIQESRIIELETCAAEMEEFDVFADLNDTIDTQAHLIKELKAAVAYRDADLDRARKAEYEVSKSKSKLNTLIYDRVTTPDRVSELEATLARETCGKSELLSSLGIAENRADKAEGEVLKLNAVVDHQVDRINQLVESRNMCAIERLAESKRAKREESNVSNLQALLTAQTEHAEELEGKLDALSFTYNCEMTSAKCSRELAEKLDHALYNLKQACRNVLHAKEDSLVALDKALSLATLDKALT